MNFPCRVLLCLFFLFSLCEVFAGGRREKPALASAYGPSPEQQSPSRTEGMNWDTTPGLSALAEPATSSAPAETPNVPDESRAEKICRALAAAYPDRIGEPLFLDGDWTIQVYGERFYFAEGRLLPASLRDKASEYAPQPFYNYPAELPSWQPPTAEESARIKAQEALRSKNPLKRSQLFYDALWRSHNRDESWEHVKQIRFLGYPVNVHYSILTQLSLVEEQILRTSQTNSAVRQWISNLKTIDAWNWRNISATESRSYHAYGAAIDFLPKSLGGLETYWLWTSRNNSDWWTVPYSKRYQPPDEVIKAFESFGFIWGGKWRNYDTMHFEYRPEILVLSGIAQTDLRDLH